MSKITDSMIRKLFETVNATYAKTGKKTIYTMMPAALFSAGRKYLPEEIGRDFDAILTECQNNGNNSPADYL